MLAAFAETGLECILDDAFAGRSIEFLLEKIVAFSKWTFEELEEVLQYNREEVRALYPWSGKDLSNRRYLGSIPPSLDKKISHQGNRIKDWIDQISEFIRSKSDASFTIRDGSARRRHRKL